MAVCIDALCLPATPPDRTHERVSPAIAVGECVSARLRLGHDALACPVLTDALASLPLDFQPRLL